MVAKSASDSFTKWKKFNDYGENSSFPRAEIVKNLNSERVGYDPHCVSTAVGLSLSQGEVIQAGIYEYFIAKY